MNRSIRQWKTVCFIASVPALLAAAAGCDRKNSGPENISTGVVIEQRRMIPLREETARAITSTAMGRVNGAGLAGVLGSARVKVLQAGAHEVLIPIPQLTDTQIPVSYSITTNPQEAGTGYRLFKKEDSNVAVGVQLMGSQNQEIQIDWASIILIVSKPVLANSSLPESFLQETACVQSGAGPITTLAKKLWPAGGKTNAYAANIQGFIRDMKQERQPRSLDALGILESGANFICTANANLAAALLRAKHIPARSLAVIPLNSQRLEMHRIVEYFDDGKWLTFDPSSVLKGIPMKPGHTIVMAKTTIADEEIAMKPRMGTSFGCPYGQELEFLDSGITFAANDFFWTTGKPIAAFEPGDEVIHSVATDWNRFLESGKLSEAQIKAASANSPADFLEAPRSK